MVENWRGRELASTGQYCIERHYAGIENLSLIPGTVGAAPIQNIGAYGIELESVFEELNAIELARVMKKYSSMQIAILVIDTAFSKKTMQINIVSPMSLYASIKIPLITSITDKFKMSSKKCKSALLPFAAISDAVMTIRRRKLPDPTLLPNAGSFFKNPVIDNALFETLQKNYPTISHYPQDNNKTKIPAAWLIEHCGWRGKRCGPVGVHENQALVIINYDHGSGKDICNLAKAIQSDVKKQFSIDLIPEVCII